MRNTWLILLGLGLCLVCSAAVENRIGGDPLVVGSGNLNLGDADTDTLLKLSDGSSNYACWDVPALAGDFTLTMPVDDGDAGEYMKTDGSGNLSFDTPSGGSSLWTDGGTFTYLTATADDLCVGSITVAASPLYFDTSAATLFLGVNNSTDGKLTMYASESGSLTFVTDTDEDITYTLPEDNPSADGQVLASTTAGVMSWTTKCFWARTGTTLDPATSGDDVVLGTGETLTLDSSFNMKQVGAPTGVSGYTSPYIGADGRVYALDATNTTTHDLSIAQKQKWGLDNTLLYEYSSDSFPISLSIHDIRLYATIANSAPNGTVGLGVVIEHNFTSHRVTSDYATVEFPVRYDTPHSAWDRAQNISFISSFDKVGKAATLVVRMKRAAYTSVNPIGSCYLGINTEGTDDEAKQACTLTTSWAEYTLTADLSAMGDQLEWFIELIPTTSTSCDEATFSIYIDEITLTQWAG